MGIFDRVSQVFKGKASNAMSRLESGNPEAVYEAALARYEERYQALKKSIAGLATQQRKDRDELAERARELEQVRVQIPIAAEDDEEAAVALLERQGVLESRISALTADIDAAEQRIAEGKSALAEYQGELEKLKREKTSMLARSATAEARLEVEESLGGLSTEADARGLANVRDHIDKLAGDAELDTRGVQRAVQQKIEQSSAQAQLAALKRELEAKKAAARGETPPAEDDDAPPDAPKKSL